MSAFTLGTMTFGGRDQFADVGSTDVAGAARQIDMCLDRGVNLIDTADVYSGGLSEEIVGQVLAEGGRRERALVATKARMPMGDGPNDAGLSRHHLIRECEASLRRLRADHIDLYQVHEWDGQTPLDETLEALDSLVRSGKVRYRSSTRCTRARPSTSSCRSRSTRGSGSSSGARWPAACCRGSTGAASRAGWVAPAHRLGVASVIVGARTDEQLQDNLAAAELVLADDELARLEEVSRPPLTYPHWHQAKTAADRLGPADLALLGPRLAR